MFCGVSSLEERKTIILFNPRITRGPERLSIRPTARRPLDPLEPFARNYLRLIVS